MRYSVDPNLERRFTFDRQKRSLKTIETAFDLGFGIWDCGLIVDSRLNPNSEFRNPKSTNLNRSQIRLINNPKSEIRNPKFGFTDTIYRRSARFKVEADFMAINENILRRPSDRNLFLVAAIAFPLLVFIGYFKTYYFSPFFTDVKPIANALVHAHGVVMSVWVIYFAVQIALIRTKNIKLHISMGLAGIVLAALVVVVGLATAYDAHIVRQVAPPGLNPHSFLIIPLAGMAVFILFFTGAIYYRKRPAEHKSLMLLTAFNFVGAAIARIPLVPEKYFLLWTFGVPDLIAIICLIWHTKKYGKINKVFAAGVILLVISHPLQIFISGTETWLRFVGWFASL